MKIIDNNLLDTVSEEARKNNRLRMNYNFHQSLDEPIHRLLNALEPGTYIIPHRHSNPDKEEIFTILRGSVLAFTFDDEGNVLTALKVSPADGVYGMEIEAGVWHSFISLEKGTMVYEIKEGPYFPLTIDNTAPWVPAIDDKEGHAKYMDDLLRKYLND